jgi:hypothetical protein
MTMLNTTEQHAGPAAVQAQLYAAVIGEQWQDYYLAYFRRADTRGYAPISWHWPALLIAMPWLLYRRNYRWAFIAFGFPYVAAFTGVMLDEAASGLGQYLFLLLLGGFQLLFMPLYANAIHYRFARQLIERARALHPGQLQQQITYLRKRGGTSLLPPTAAMTVLLLIASLAGPGG